MRRVSAQHCRHRSPGWCALLSFKTHPGSATPPAAARWPGRTAPSTFERAGQPRTASTATAQPAAPSTSTPAGRRQSPAPRRHHQDHRRAGDRRPGTAPCRSRWWSRRKITRRLVPAADRQRPALGRHQLPGRPDPAAADAAGAECQYRRGVRRDLHLRGLPAVPAERAGPGRSLIVAAPRVQHVEHCMGTVFSFDIREPGARTRPRCRPALALLHADRCGASPPTGRTAWSAG